MLYSNVIRPALFNLDPERIHRRTVGLCHYVSRSPAISKCVRALYDYQDDALAVSAMGLQFRNPVGLAAGFDKHAQMFGLVPDLGFGHMEIGSVSFQPWRGNPSPTLLRLPLDNGLINRPGLNSVGSTVVRERLRGADFRIPTGLSLVKTADPDIHGDAGVADYLQNLVVFYDAADFITLNLSCPNTAEGQTFENPDVLDGLLETLQGKARELARRHGKRPILIKLSPDLDDQVLNRVLAVTEKHGVDGYVLANTTVRRVGLRTPAAALEQFGFGGLSGYPLTKYVAAMVRKVRGGVSSDRLIVAAGGIGCDPSRHPAETVWEMLNLGATLVQVHTGLIYRGPGLARTINTGLLRILNENGYRTLSEFLASRALSRSAH